MHLLFLIALYFLPAIIAHLRHSVSAVGITIVNLLFGWTGIGWLATLIWTVFSTSWDNRYHQQFYAARYPARW